MRSLLYLSTATSLLSDEEIINILNTSRSFNQKHSITGLLLYHQGSFLQVIEGEKDIIHSLFYKKISLDKRHEGIILLLDEQTNERSFSEWSMGFKQIANNDWSELEGYLDLGNTKKFNKIANSGTPEVITIIKSFSDVNRLNI